jgi:Serine/Threonine/Tyrosine Kinase found in polyvalent proteins
MLNDIKYELQYILSGKGEVKYGSTIQTIASYLRRSKETGGLASEEKSFKSKEKLNLINWINSNNFWYDTIDFSLFVSEGAEQKVYLKDDNFVLKLNDSIYYESWLDYFYNLLLNNYFFPDTAYELIGFHRNSDTLYAVVKQRFVKVDQLTDLNEVKVFLGNNGFENIRNNDYYNPFLGIILEDLHDENVLTQQGILYFIDTVFYLKSEIFWE